MITPTPIKVLHVCMLDVTAHILLTPQLQALRRKGYEVHIACRPGEFVHPLAQAGFHVHSIGFAKKVLSLAHLSGLAALVRVMRRERYEVVHVHNVITGVLGRVAARLAEVPTVFYTLHGLYFHEHMQPWIRWGNIWLERFCGRYTDFMLSQAEEDRETAVSEHLIEEEKIVTIGNGVDIDRFSDPRLCREAAVLQRKRDLGIPLTAPVIGTVGRIVKEKGFREFFDAAVAVSRRCPRAVFLIVGDTLETDRGKFSSKLRSLIHHNGMESKFFFVNFRLETERFYPIMDVFVLPSHREGMPRAIIEAMAAGRPVVATNIRGCREEVVEGETGYLVPVKDSDALARGMLKLIENPVGARRMGQAGQRRAKELFDERVVCDRVTLVYHELLRDKLPRKRREGYKTKAFALSLKRGLDCWGSSLLLVLMSPLMALIALMIKLEWRGEVLFRQVRMGLRGRPFTMYKFRSMAPGSERGGLSVLPSDPRVTRVGHWLRSFSLDELPQLVNILKGEMSFVGPRPLLPEQVEHMTVQDRRRLEMLPGLTNLPALYGRNTLAFEKRMRIDLWYVEHWSLWLDVKILLKTPWVVLSRGGAYTSPEAAGSAERVWKDS